VLACPAILPEEAEADGADEAFSEVVGAVALVLLASPVGALLEVLGAAWVEAVAELLGDEDCEAVAPEAFGVVALDCCELPALEFMLEAESVLVAELLGAALALALDAGADDAAPLVELLGVLLAFAGALLLPADFPALEFTFTCS
jgi:hypothetical protein